MTKMVSRALFILVVVIMVATSCSMENAASAQTASSQRSHERAAAADNTNKDEKQAELLRLKVFHYEVVNSLRSGKSIDEAISKQTVSKLASSAGYSAHTTSKESMYFRDNLVESPDQLKYRDALKAAEDAMVLMGAEKVTVEIDAQPQRCQVAYSEVASGASHAFGQTKASHKLDPKYYDFVCDCLGAPVHAMLDCTSDQSYTFKCGNSAH